MVDTKIEATLEEDGYELVNPSDVDAAEQSAIPTTKIRKLCACGCGEEVSGNRALRRGHTIAIGLGSVWAPEDLIILQSGLTGLIMGITVWIEHKRNIPRMELEEVQALANPLGRIGARHTPKKLLKYMKPGDISDCIAIGSVLSAYTLRISMSEKKEQNANSGLNNDQTISGYADLSKYLYRPEASQPQNGASYPTNIEQNG